MCKSDVVVIVQLVNCLQLDIDTTCDVLHFSLSGLHYEMIIIINYDVVCWSNYISKEIPILGWFNHISTGKFLVLPQTGLPIYINT